MNEREDIAKSLESQTDQPTSSRQSLHIAITGATGFIGSALTRAYLERGDQVSILVRATSNRERSQIADELVESGAQLIHGDLDDQQALNMLCHQASLVIHCAAFMGKRDSALSEQVNIKGTRHLLQAAHQNGVKRLIYISSISVYRGTPSTTRIFDEKIEPYLHPQLNHYSRTKLLGEHLVTEFCTALSNSQDSSQDSSQETNSSPLSFTIIRPTNVYGPRCKPWGTDVEQFTSRYHICFGRVTFNFIHIDDLVNGIMALSEHQDAKNTTFNLGAEPLELWAFQKHIAHNIGAWTIRVPSIIDAMIRHLANLYAKLSREVRSTGYVKRFIYPHDKAKSVCGYQPQHLINSSLKSDQEHH